MATANALCQKYKILILISHLHSISPHHLHTQEVRISNPMLVLVKQFQFRSYNAEIILFSSYKYR